MNVYQALLRDGAAKRSLWKCEKCGAHAQDVTELVEALEAAQRWHNGDKWRDTDKHEEWQIQADSLTAALSKYKGAK